MQRVRQPARLALVRANPEGIELWPTLLLLAIYRIGFWIPLPVVNQEQLQKFFNQSGEGAEWAKILSTAAQFSATQLDQASIFGINVATANGPASS